MRTPRGLSDEEAAAWARLAASVVPLRPEPPFIPVTISKSQPNSPPRGEGLGEGERTAGARPSPRRGTPPPNHPPSGGGLSSSAPANPGLDSHWERRLRAGSLAPDFTLDLHEHSLDAAYQRLLGGLDIARETGARAVLVSAGRERPTHAADRAGSRGAIRAKLLDWLAASRHASAIAAVRKAHRRHGGEGALYVILKKPR